MVLEKTDLFRSGMEVGEMEDLMLLVAFMHLYLLLILKLVFDHPVPPLEPPSSVSNTEDVEVEDAVALN